MSTERVWERDWVISPGETLADWMDENGLTLRLVARVCQMDAHEVERILCGQRRITPVVAGKLAAGTRIPARLWLNLERAFRDGLAEGKVWSSAPRHRVPYERRVSA